MNILKIQNSKLILGWGNLLYYEIVRQQNSGGYFIRELFCKRRKRLE